MESKLSEFNISISDSRLDNAQYIMMMIMEKFKIGQNVGEESLSLYSKGMFKKTYKENLGILIGSLNNVFGKFEFYINGIPNIFTPMGNKIVESQILKQYLLGENAIKTLHFDSKAYILILNTTYPEKYYGVFYSIGDAIKIANENDFVKIGEVTS